MLEVRPDGTAAPPLGVEGPERSTPPFDAAVGPGSRELADNCGPGPSHQLDRRHRWQLLGTLWRHSTIRRQAYCRRFARGDLVSIEKRWSGNQCGPVSAPNALRGGREIASYSGLQTCGSPWTCPCCGPKIAVERAADIALALTAHVANGGQVAMLTLTLPHSRAQRLSDLLDGLSGAWSALRQNKTPRRLLAAHTTGWIKRLEVTWGLNGWHPHLHVLLFLEPGTTAADVEAIAAAAYTAWSGRLIRQGLGQPSERHGVTCKLLDLAAAHEKVADYVAKSAAFELASAGTKRARGENRTPMQLLADVTALGLADDLAAWHEFEAATKGKRTLQWSLGLRDRLIGEVPELTDEQAAESNDGAARLLACLTAAGWKIVRQAGLVASLLDWAEVSDDDDQAREHIRHQLAAHHLQAGLFDPPSEPVPQLAEDP